MPLPFEPPLNRRINPEFPSEFNRVTMTGADHADRTVRIADAAAASARFSRATGSPQKKADAVLLNSD
jgi:hypothetical protein